MGMSTSGPRKIPVTRDIPEWLRERTPAADLSDEVIVRLGLENMWYDHYMARQRCLLEEAINEAIGGPA